MTPPVIETERLTLRGHVMDDWEPMADFYASERSRFVGGPLSRNWAWYGFAADVGSWALLGFGGLAITDRVSGAFLGQVSFSKPPHSPERELGWLVVEAAEGRGIAYEAVTAARAYAFETLGWPRVVSFIQPDNRRSLALAQRLGAVYDPFAESITEDRGVFRHPAPRVHA